MVKARAGAAEPLTMADLAKLAGVSKITVSRALRDSTLVRQEVRERIKQIAAANGYRLNTAARNLRTRRTHSITAVVEMNPSNERLMSEPLILPVIGGLLQEMAMNGYRLVLTTRAEAISSNEMDTEGIILLGEGANGQASQEMQRFDLPMIVWGVHRPAQGHVAFVGSDNFEGGRLVGAHLADIGRRRILFLGDPHHQEIADRLDGLRAGVAGRDVEVEIAPCAFSREAARSVVAAALDRTPRIDAVAAGSDAMALGALDALDAAGLRAPQDVAVTGYDDAMQDPRLTSVRQAWNRVGALLAEMMFGLLAGREVASQTLPVELIVRGSTQA